jgi:hypothetical protein
MSSRTSTISEDSAGFLITFGEELTSINGFIRLSRGSYSESSEESDWGTTTQIPELLESTQALRFIGFKKRVGEQIYSRWSDARRDFPYMPTSIFEFAKATIMGAFVNAMTAEDDWDAALKEIGMNKVTREGILDPKFEYLRLTRSAKEWAVDTAEMGWRFLVNLDRTVQKNKGKIIKDHLPNGPATRAGRRSQMSSDVSTSQDSRLVLSLEAEIPRELPGFQYLYKGADMERLKQLSSPNDEARFQGRMLSTPPSDFSPNRPLLYLTKSKKCAYGYAEFAKRRSNNLSVGVLHLAVPNDVLNNSHQIFGEDWRELIWASRGPEAYIPSHLKEYTTMPLLIGEVCGAGNDQIQGMQDKSEIQPMRLDDGTKPSQHVFQTEEKYLELGARCQNTAWVVEIRDENSEAKTEAQKKGEGKGKK